MRVTTRMEATRSQGRVCGTQMRFQREAGGELADGRAAVGAAVEEGVVGFEAVEAEGYFGLAGDFEKGGIHGGG